MTFKTGVGLTARLKKLEGLIDQQEQAIIKFCFVDGEQITHCSHRRDDCPTPCTVFHPCWLTGDKVYVVYIKMPHGSKVAWELVK